MVEVMADDLWTPYKHLNGVIDGYLYGPTGLGESSVSNLELILRKHKQNFLNLLRNTPKNAQSREEIRKGITDGVTLPGIGHTVLSKDLVDESIIISDMYNLNEYIALELLCTAQQQMPHHPGLPRGLVAVLLYYDGRKTLVTILRQLFQARNGISWCLEISEEISQLITNYTDSLIQNGILDKIIDLLESLDITKEIGILSENRALGSAKHHRQVVDLFEEIRVQLATILYCSAAQCGLTKSTTNKLLKYLSKYKTTDSRGAIDDVTLAMLMALLYAFDLSVLQKREDGEEVVRKLPIVTDFEYSQCVLDNLYLNWECEELKSIAMFAFGLTMAQLRQAPPVLQQNSTRIIDQDEVLVECAIQNRLFEYIYHSLLINEKIYSTEFYFRRLHVLFGDFIELMHSKVTELRARADETARTVQCHIQEGLDPPSNLCRNFETLLLIVGKLYSSDKLHLCLDLEYWGPMELPGNYQRSTTRSVSLFKFVRLAGELLPPTLFIPYLKMLAGLSSCQQSARNAFNLLKQGSAISGSTTLSWDHFFGSFTRYYTTLRQEQHPVSDTIYRNRAINRNINPQEIAGLQAVLSVIRAVATNDEVARIALCEHPNWSPLQVLLGLVCCSIVIPLKTDLLLTLAALAKSKETAIQLWINLESSQIITTVPTISNYTYRGIETELEQIESRNETYPLTQALLEFLYVLSSTCIPKNLGAGPRKPGIDPYLTFLMDSMFLRFYNRNYKDVAEKWLVAEKCLKIFNYFMNTYEVSPTDFPMSGSIKDENNSQPGFHIMLQMNINDKSEFLKLILQIIDESCTLIDKYTPFPGKVHLENSAFYCLNIIERALALQSLFFDAHFAANCSILMSGINKLLLGVNRRSDRPDHMLNIVKFITYNSWLPKHSLVAVKILNYITRQTNVNSLLLGEFTRTSTLSNEIRHGFVECLESDNTKCFNAVGTYNDELDLIQNEKSTNIDGLDDNNETVELSLKEAIIQLLEDCLPQSAPNLTHYLLGFDITKDVRSTRLQQPGVMDFPSTCIRSLVTILDNGLEQKYRIRNIGQERLLQSAYRLLYLLCFNTKTSEVVLRFLRSCNDFLCRHISALPFKHVQSPRVLNQMTGLLKCAAIELKMTAENNQVTLFSNICKILLGNIQNLGNFDDYHQQQFVDSTLVGRSTSTIMFQDSRDIGGGGGCSSSSSIVGSNTNLDNSGLLICKLFDCLTFEMKPIVRPKWDFFENSLMQQLLQTCETMGTDCIISNSGGNSSSIKLINIKKLHDILRDELNIVQSTIASGQRQLILKEIESVLMYAVQVNLQKKFCMATIKFLEAWGQVTEILFTVAPTYALSYETRQCLLLEILQYLLNKIVPLEIIPELSNLASSTVLQLLVNLRVCYVQINNPTIGNLTQSTTHNNYPFMLSGNKTLDNSNSTVNQHRGSPYTTPAKTNTLSLKYILKSIVEWIIISGVASQKLRINLYATLLNFIHIIKVNKSRMNIDSNDEQYVSRLDKSMSLEQNVSVEKNEVIETSQTQMAIEVFTAFGDKLIDILCHDCIGGHDVCKMLSLSCIDMLLDLDSMIGFIQFIATRGYLGHLVDSLLKADNQLCLILETMPDNMKALYVYESKIAMLSKIASTHIGAELLLEHRILGVLSTMKVYDMHPDFQINNMNQSQQQVSSFEPISSSSNKMTLTFIPSVERRYQDILLPALNFCDIILSTLGPENHSAMKQVIHFLLSHGDMIEIVLRAGTPFLNIGLLKELSAITGLIARTTNQELTISLIDPNSNQDLSAHLYRLQKLMLSLFPRFILNETMLKLLQKQDNTLYHRSEKEISEQMKIILQIACNLALYARNAIANHSADHRTTGVIFSPNINEGVQRNEVRSGALDIVPSLNVIVQQLKSSIEYYNREKTAFDGLLRQQRNTVAAISLDINNASQNRDIRECLTNKQNELKLSIFLTEHCLYILWAHLDFFMLRAIPVSSLQFKSFNTTDNNVIKSSMDAGWKVTSEDVSNLKKILVQVFNETFCKQLNAASQNQLTSGKGFIDALLRRIQRLIQFVPAK